jgi:hypothetical protein
LKKEFNKKEFERKNKCEEKLLIFARLAEKIYTRFELNNF